MAVPRIMQNVGMVMHSFCYLSANAAVKILEPRHVKTCQSLRSHSLSLLNSDRTSLVEREEAGHASDRFGT